ncbi:MAG TPA: ATP-dependent DNA ligase, partial [Kofleriaceae bacterium]|nr:ATP-dependent DNA ligase [Kofleriaceae bacterium]
MAKATKQILELDGVEVTLSNPDKIYFPKAGITKRELVDYYLAVEPGILRALARRPMILKRYVNGAEGEPFYQKRAPAKRPD